MIGDRHPRHNAGDGQGDRCRDGRPGVRDADAYAHALRLELTCGTEPRPGVSRTLSDVIGAWQRRWPRGWGGLVGRGRHRGASRARLRPRQPQPHLDRAERRSRPRYRGLDRLALRDGACGEPRARHGDRRGRGAAGGHRARRHGARAPGVPASCRATQTAIPAAGSPEQARPTFDRRGGFGPLDPPPSPGTGPRPHRGADPPAGCALGDSARYRCSPWPRGCARRWRRGVASAAARCAATASASAGSATPLSSRVNLSPLSRASVSPGRTAERRHPATATSDRIARPPARSGLAPPIRMRGAVNLRARVAYVRYWRVALPSYGGYRCPAGIVVLAVWRYCRFALSYHAVAELLAECGITVTDETIRRTTPALLGLFSLVTLLAHERISTLPVSPAMPRGTARSVRRAPWQHQAFQASPRGGAIVKVPRELLARLSETLCYVA